MSDLNRRLLARSERNDEGCLVWLGVKNPKGYGQLKIHNRTTSVHRAAYREWVGALPDDLEIDHLCHNRACIEPTHLEAVTHQENITRSRPYRATHCPQGHAYEGDNVMLRTNSKGYTVRKCRACGIAQRRAYRAAKKAAS